MYVKKAIYFEQKRAYKKALKCLKLAKSYAYNNYFINDLKEEETRIKDKMPKKKKDKKKGASSKKSKKHKNNKNE